MDREQVVTMAVALCCLTSVAVASTTLDSTVSQTPDDIIDVQDTQLPIGDDSTSDIDQQIARNKQSQNGDATAGQPGAADDRQGATDDDGTRENRRSGQSQAASQSAGGGDDTTGNGGQSLLERLLDLLRALWPVAAVLVVLGLAYRYRERLLGVLLLPLGLLGGTGERRDAPGPDPWANADPNDRIDRAWYAMVRRLDIERPWAKTPDECERAAVEAGLDPDAVGTLTRLYRHKRFAGDGLSQSARQRAVESIERLDIGGTGR